MHAGQTDNDTNRSKWLTRPAGGHAKPPSRSLGGRVLDVGIKQSWKQRKCADQKSFRLSHSFCTTRSPSFESLFLPVQELNNNLIATMRATPLLIAIATLLSLTFASALPTAESNIPIPSSTLRTHIRAASTPPPAATPANAAATPAATGATCFDDGDCILSGGKCMKTGLILGNCAGKGSVLDGLA